MGARLLTKAQRQPRRRGVRAESDGTGDAQVTSPTAIESEVMDNPDWADVCLRQKLERTSERDAEFWSFRGNANRDYAHGCFQYPAMTVPQLQRHLMRTVREVVPSTLNVYDPFVGSGTVMTEAMLQGLNFYGKDINPLAVLVCRSKIGPYVEGLLRSEAETLLARIRRDHDQIVPVSFRGLGKWFRDDVALDLSRVYRGVQGVLDPGVRRLCWVALAETVRLSSNSRTSTFKLHIRPEDEIVARKIDAVTVFESVLRENIASLLGQATLLEERGYVTDGAYAGSVVVELGDTMLLSNPNKDEPLADLLVTSPPYGDNTTTVPYGQHSYLPLQWIDPQDLDPRYDPSYLSTTHEIDRRSLGGTRRGALEAVRTVRERSPALDETLRSLEDEPRDRALRVAAFFRDMDKTLDPILSRLRTNAYMLWTVGNRSVGNRAVPLDTILTELLTSRGAVHVASLRRRIPSKRMAAKNSVTSTMSGETILVLRKGR